MSDSINGVALPVWGISYAGPKKKQKNIFWLYLVTNKKIIFWLYLVTNKKYFLTLLSNKQKNIFDFA